MPFPLPSSTAVRAFPAPPGAAIVAGYLTAYVALDWVSYIQPVGAFPITPWNPPPGLSLAFLLRFGPRHGAWLFVAALVAEALVRGLTAPAWVLVGSSAIPALAYTATAALLVRASLDTRMASLRHMALFLGVVLVATGIVALSLVALYHGAGLLRGKLTEAVAQSWIGDFVGIAVTTPALLLLTSRRPWAEIGWRPALMHLGAVAAAFWLVFGSSLTEQSRLFYVLFLPLVWIAMQHGLAGAVFAMVVIQVGLVAVLGSVPGALLDYQFLMLVLCLTGLLLGAAVSERRRIESALHDQQHALERSLRMAAASELASALAHELQQPLTALGNYVRAGALMAERSDVPADELKSTMDKAVRESERASMVVRRLRDFFRTGRVALERVEPRALATGAAVAIRERVARHGIGLQLVLESGPVPDVQVDRVQIEGVLSNLLGNAIDALKAMPGERSIRLVVAAVGTDVRFSVEDNGPGVPAETAGRLFEHFTTSKPQGMGLGLSISRSIVQAHGGRIWHDRLPQGSAFRFTLPAA